ncbi:MAG: hypothetical protein ACREH3_18865, partial [Geminicoccales bacterium]
VLKQAALAGLRELRLERAIQAYRDGAGSAEAAELAGLGRAEFLWELMEAGVVILEGPSNLGPALAYMARELGDEKMAALARRLMEGATEHAIAR